MAKPVYILLHLYKTAGQTLRHNIMLNRGKRQALPMYVGPMGLDIYKAEGSSANPGWVQPCVSDYVVAQSTPQTDIIYGHMAYYGMHELLAAPVEPRYIVFFRDPVQRLVSLYFYLKNNSRNRWHDEIAQSGWDLETWIERTAGLWCRDGQLRQLLIGSDQSVLEAPTLTRAHLEEGKRRLDKFWFVGLTENFDADSYYLYGQMGFRRFYPEARVNVTPRKDPVPARVLERIAQHNPLDSELYAYARQVRARQLRARPAAYWLSQYQARMRRALFVARHRHLTGEELLYPNKKRKGE